MSREHRKLITKTTKCRADKRGGRVFLDVFRPRSVRSMGGREHMILVKNVFLGCLLYSS